MTQEALAALEYAMANCGKLQSISPHHKLLFEMAEEGLMKQLDPGSHYCVVRFEITDLGREMVKKLVPPAEW